MAELAQESLHWVSTELAGTLKEARQALEQYADDTGNRDLLRDCARALHSAHGALRMVEVYGAALLAEEMVAVCKSLYKDTSRSESEALDALSRAVVQMPAYLDRVLAGGRDIPLVLLPLLNDLRAVRGSPLLSESTLFVLNIAPDQGEASVETKPSGEDILFVGRRLRPRYQAGLLGWLRGEQVESNLATMGVVAKNLSQAATSGAFFQLWWVTGAVIEALRDEGLPPSAAVKRLLGQADRQIKRLLDEGERAFDSNPPTDLLNNLLYYVARASSAGELVQAVKSSFSLIELFPGAQAVEDDHAALSAPSATLMSTVGTAIKQDLSAVKDSLDLFVRSGMQDLDGLGDQLGQLKKVADTLGLLGLGELRAFVDTQRDTLAALVDNGGQKPDEATLLSIAEALLSVEDRLDKELLDAISPVAAIAAAGTDGEKDFQQVSAAVIRECIVNLARVKDAITQFIAQPELPRALDAVPDLLQGINAGMLLLEKPRVVSILERVSDYIVQRVGSSDRPPMTHTLDRLADAIVSVEYYLETLQNGRSDPWYMLDNAQTCLDALGAPERTVDEEPADEASAQRASAGAEAAAQSQEHDQDQDQDQDQESEREQDQESNEEQGQEQELAEEHNAPREPASDAPEARAEYGEVNTQPGRARDVRAALKPAVAGGMRDAVDPDLLELFIEEAKEELAAIREHQPPFAANPDDRSCLLGLRRSFHTLKGSGRMVGAEAIGEFAWVIENLLNRVVDGTRPAGPGMLGVLESSITALEELIENLEVGAPFKVDIPGIMAAAQALIDGEPVPGELEHASDSDAQWLDAGDDEDSGEHSTAETGAAPQANATDSAVDAPEQAAEALADDAQPQAMDPVLYEIFSKEARGHLQVLRDFVAQCGESPEPHALTEQVHRACHTLKGSANMAAADAAVAIATPMNRFIRKAYDARADLSDDDVALMGQAVALIEDIVTRINTAHPVVDDHAELAARFEALEKAVEASESPLPAEAEPGSEADREPEADAAASEQDEPTGLFESTAPVAPAEATEHPPDVDEAPESDDFDHEIAAIFSEEAAELLDASDLALQGLASAPGNVALLAELQRYLHSLKGGARMAGLRAMGDLSHELESLLIAIDNGRCSADSQTLEVIQRSLDRLHGMRDELQSGHASTQAADLVAQVRALSHGRDLPEAAAQEPPSAASIGAESGPGPEDAAPEEAASSEELASFDMATDGHDADEAPASSDAPKVMRGFDEVDLTTGAEVSEQTSSVDPLEQGGSADEHVAASDAVPASEDDAAEMPAVARADSDSGSEPLHIQGDAESPRPSSPERRVSVDRGDVARVDAELLDELLNNAGEVSIYHSRLEQQVNSISFNLAELSQTVSRLRDQFRSLEVETEAEIIHRHQVDAQRREDFDPLEMDRYSTIQQLSRALAESCSDLSSLQGLLEDLTQETETLLVQQSRVTTELQDGLMRTRMVPFRQYLPRFSRLVRQTAREYGKQIELELVGTGELDRQVLERMVPPFEHMLRNAVVHGAEAPDERRRAGKPATATITISLRREGSEMVIEIADDGAGMDVERILRSARERGLIDEDVVLSDSDALQLILEPGFSTASELTQAAGRGVGMDVVANEVKQLSGRLEIDSVAGKGATFTVRLPLTLAISQALLVRTADESYAIPMPTVEGIVRLPKTELLAYLEGEEPGFEYGEQHYRFEHLGLMLGGRPANLVDAGASVPVVLVRAGEHSSALITDEIIGSREVVVKNVGPQIASIRGVAGATILGDGSIIIILDVHSLVRAGVRHASKAAVEARVDERPLILVVDDSITVRRVTERLLERNDMRVVTARDGVDAVSIMQDLDPHLILLDIEMPRMDGYEVASHVRNSARTRDVPIVMVTSRVGDKHRARAFELGVNDYLGKPYQESQLLAAIKPLLESYSNLRRSGTER